MSGKAPLARTSPCRPPLGRGGACPRPKTRTAQGLPSSGSLAVARDERLMRSAARDAPASGVRTLLPRGFGSRLRHSSPRTRPRPALTRALRTFAARRRSRAPCVGRVLFRDFGLAAARRTSSTRRSLAAARFCACVRCSRLSIKSTPPEVILLPASAINRALTSSSSGDAPTSNRSSTAVATLLTFCPPGPDERTNRSSSSSSRIVMAGVTRSISRSAYFLRLSPARSSARSAAPSLPAAASPPPIP